MHSSTPVISAHQVTWHVTLGGKTIPILNNISMEVYASEVVAIVGRSGSGKTSLLSILAGLHLPTSGTVQLLGQHLNALDEDQRATIRLGQIAFVFQSFELLPELTALENVMLPLQITGQPNPEKQARQWLNKVGLHERIRHFPTQLSGGEQQRVAIARAFVTNPKIVFADEPTGNLDEATAKAISDLMFDLNEKYGTTMVFVTHDQALAHRCHRTFSMRSGTLLNDETLVS